MSTGSKSRATVMAAIGTALLVAGCGSSSDKQGAGNGAAKSANATAVVTAQTPHALSFRQANSIPKVIARSDFYAKYGKPLTVKTPAGQPKSFQCARYLMVGQTPSTAVWEICFQGERMVSISSHAGRDRG